jgi:hypothetical protein
MLTPNSTARAARLAHELAQVVELGGGREREARRIGAVRETVARQRFGHAGRPSWLRLKRWRDRLPRRGA